MRSKRLALISGILLCFQMQTQFAQAGYFEASASGSYSSSDYGASSGASSSPTNYSWSRRWSASFGYYIAALSEIEFAAQDVFTRTSITGLQDTSFHDQVYSFNWVQALLPKEFIIQPFVKIGFGQLNREAQGIYSNGSSPPLILDSLTAVLGAGARIYLFRSMAFRGEATTYLTNGQISTWQNNFGLSLGFSFYF